MPLNQYHNHYTANNEQTLTEDLIVEAIQMKGILVKYMPRTHNDYNSLYGEDPTSSFNSATEIEMYPADVNGFGGDGELMSKFGLDINDTATFVVSKRRFLEEFPTEIRPSEGDVLFMPITNALLEIKFVNHESPFFEQGAQLVFEIKLESFNPSYEQVSTTDSEVDGIFNDLVDFDTETNTEEYGDNNDYDTDFEPDTSFDPSNPFSL